MQLSNAKIFAPGAFPYPYVSKTGSIKEHASAVAGLIIPVYKVPQIGATPEVASFQWIFDPDPQNPDAKRKLFAQAPEGSLKGGFAIAGELSTLSEDAPVIGIAEGYATGLTINHVTGHLVLCALSLGNIGNVLNWLCSWYKGKIIIYGDNDTLKGAGGKTVDTIKKLTRKQGVYYCIPKVEGTQNGSDFNDIYVELGTQVCQEQLDDVYPKPEPIPQFVSLEKGQEIARNAIAEWEKGKNVILKMTAGGGKTYLVKQEVARILSKARGDFMESGKRFEGYFPSIRIAQEVGDDMQAMGINVLVQRGREKTARDGTPMCERSDLVMEAIACGVYNIQKAFCTDGMDKCPNFDSCPYQMQFKNIIDRDVVLKQHDMLTMGRSTLEGPAPDLIVVDEKFTKILVRKTNILLDNVLIPNPRTYDSIQDKTGLEPYDAIRKPLFSALGEGGEEVVWTLMELGITKEQLQSAFDSIEIEIPDISATYSEQQIKANIALYRERAGYWKIVKRILKALIKDYKLIEENEPGARLPLNHFSKIRIMESGARTLVLAEYREPTRLKGIPVLHIDADADRNVIEQIFKDDDRELVFEECHLEQNLRVRQLLDTPVSATQLATERTRGERTGKGDQWRRITEEQAIQYSQAGDDVLVTGPKRTMDEIVTSKIESACVKSKGTGRIAVEHFNNLLGINLYNQFKRMIVVGRNQMSVDELEDTARGLFHDKHLNLLHGVKLPYVSRCLQTKSGRVYEVSVQEHPDPYINTVLKLSRECETLQSIARLRGVRANDTRHVDIFSNLPLPNLLIDEVVTREGILEGLEKDWVKGNELKEALRKHFTDDYLGVMPLKPSQLSALHGYDETSIKRACKLLGDYPDKAHDYINTPLSFTSITFKAKGRGNALCRALVSWDSTLETMSTAIDVAIDQLQDRFGYQDIELLDAQTDIEAIDFTESNSSDDQGVVNIKVAKPQDTPQSALNDEEEEVKTSDETTTYETIVPMLFEGDFVVTTEDERAPPNIDSVVLPEPVITRVGDAIRAGDEREEVKELNTPAKVNEIVSYLRSQNYDSTSGYVNLNLIADEIGFSQYALWEVVTTKPNLFAYRPIDNTVKLLI